MKRTCGAWILLSASCLLAQSAPSPELGLDINAQTDAVVSRGWPLVIRAALISADGQPLQIGLTSGAWTQALHLTVTGPDGSAQNWSMQLVPPAAPSLTLNGFNSTEAVWLVAPGDTASIAAGTYSLAVTLDTTTGAAAGAWSGTIHGNGASVQFQVEPSPLAAEDEASKYLAFAAYARLRGDTQGAASALDTLIAHQPSMLEAYIEKGDLLSAGGDYAGALGLYQQTLSQFLAANPNAGESLTFFTRRIDAAARSLAGQQQAAAGVVTCVAPGGLSTVFAPDSIVNAYGSSLATGPLSAVSSLTTSLNGTTVTIKDSTGASVLAPLFYVAPLQVNYAVPPGVAQGAATITVKSGDGTTRTGTATITDIQPGLFVLNADGLIAGSIVRGTTDGRQIYQNLYSLDASNNIIAAPVDLSKDKVYLVLYGTGIRHASTSQVTVTIDGVTLPADYAGSQGFYIGLDQVDVVLPPSLAGRGDVSLVVTAAGKESNITRITIK